MSTASWLPSSSGKRAAVGDDVGKVRRPRMSTRMPSPSRQTARAHVEDHSRRGRQRKPGEQLRESAAAGNMAEDARRLFAPPRGPAWRTQIAGPPSGSRRGPRRGMLVPFGYRERGGTHLAGLRSCAPAGWTRGFERERPSVGEEKSLARDVALTSRSAHRHVTREGEECFIAPTSKKKAR